MAGDGAQTESVQSWVARHATAVFTLAALLASYAALGLMILVDRGHLPGRSIPSRIGWDMEEASSLVLVLVLLATTVTVTHVVEGPAGLNALASRITRWRVDWRWWLTGVAAVPAVTVGLAVVFGDELVAPRPMVLLDEVVAAAVALLLINLAEETSWAGFLQTRLERAHSLPVAAVLTAVPFALVHIPIRVVAREIDGPADLLPQFAVLMVLCIIIRVLLGGVMRGAGNSLLVVAATHTSFNRSNNVDGIAADLLVGQARTLAALVAAVVVATLVLVALRGRPGRVRRTTSDGRAPSTMPE
ncbi:MAG TPA: CPBP family intramembrane glutamic endopeptidase [Nocardioides sp.]